MATSALIKTSAKVAIGVGAVYVTISQGVWSSSSMGTQALNQVRTSVLPEANQYVEKAPSKRVVNQTVVDYWNYGVERAFNGLVRSPEVIKDYSCKAVETVKQNLK